MTPAQDEPMFDIIITCETGDSLMALMNEFGIDAGCRWRPQPSAESKLSVRAVASEGLVRRLEGERCRLEIVGDARQRWAKTRSLVSKGDRFEGGHVLPKGLATFRRTDEGESQP